MKTPEKKEEKQNLMTTKKTKIMQLSYQKQVRTFQVR